MSDGDNVVDMAGRPRAAERFPIIEARRAEIREEVAAVIGPIVKLFEDFAVASGAERVAALRLSHTILNRLAAIDARLARLEAAAGGRVDPPG